MAWTVIVQVPRSRAQDVVKYKLFRNGTLDGEVAQPPAGGPLYTFTIPEDGMYNLTATAVDGQNHEGDPSAPLGLKLDHVSPEAPDMLILVTQTWTP